MSDRREGLPEPDGGGNAPADDLDPDFLDDDPPEIDDADDGGGQDEIAEEEPEEELLEPAREPQRRQPGRAARRIDALLEQNRLLTQQLAQRTGQAPVVDPGVAQRAAAEEERRFNESLIGLMPEEIALRVSERTEQRLRGELAQMELRGFDRSDKANFDALAGRDRFAQAKSNEVEAALANMRASGIYQFGRLDILDFLRGRETRLRGEKTGQQERRNGQRRLARETTRPASGRGDGERGNGRRRSEEDSDMELLRRGTVGDALNM